MNSPTCLLRLIMVQTACVQAFTETPPATRSIFKSIFRREDVQPFLPEVTSESSIPAVIESSRVADDEFTFAMDFETRRQRRLDRLDQSISSTIAPFHADFLEENEPQSNPIKLPKNLLGDNFLMDVDQHNSILSDAPAILLESGAGTGKTTVLAGKVAHLLRTKQIEPQKMIILSFTRRDAESLKTKALHMLYGEGEESHDKLGLPSKESLESTLWCGTIHLFAINILRKLNKNDIPLRVIPTREMKSRIRSCLGRINTSDKERLMRYRTALEDSKQSVGTLVHYIMRCLELWKEAGVLSTPYAYSIKFLGVDEEVNNNSLTKDDYVELAMRLGIPQNAAVLALDVAGDYQTMHATMGTADPSDVALMAYDFLISNPKECNAIRSKLQQVILDEYQDVSVSQHKLLRLFIRGPDDDEAKRHVPSQRYDGSKPKTLMPVLIRNQPLRKSKSNELICYHVPKIICAGDCNQSIYGWRGAAPSLTVDGFRKDYPQGLVVPLSTNYRLPRPILNAANVLIGGDYYANDASIDPTSFDISPAAAISAAEFASKHSSRNVADEKSSTRADVESDLSIGQTLLLEEGVMSESSSSVFIQGLWDQREEAKFIAAEIRKRSKERCKNLARALNKLEMNEKIDERGVYDSTDVAVMVRSSSQIKMIEEALKRNGVPCVVPKGDDKNNSDISINLFERRQRKLLPMKPVKLITMHRAKGDEFDDVYLASWTEGVFPHKSSLSSNRLHEERRIAYVACTRARQRVVLTYAFVKMVSYFGADGKKKDVTEQVEPSRFLYDLMATSGKSRGPPSIEWSDSYGFKEHVASKNLPPHYAKSYKVPDGYTKIKTSGTSHLSVQSPLNGVSEEEAKEIVDTTNEIEKLIADVTSEEEAKEREDTKNGIETLIADVTNGLNQIFSKKLGSCRKYRKIFLSMLREYGIKRGTALVLTKDGKKELSKSVDVLINAPSSSLTTRALSRCTAEQLGQYLIYLLHQGE